jgi:hypothetical protein
MEPVGLKILKLGQNSQPMALSAIYNDKNLLSGGSKILKEKNLRRRHHTADITVALRRRLCYYASLEHFFTRSNKKWLKNPPCRL